MGEAQMSDLVELLRDDFSAELKDSDPHTVINAYEEERHRAADHIDALNAALEAYATETMERIDELEAALRRLAETDLTGIARAALEKKDD
jgi:cell division septum initiation protein DivIVA